MMQDRLSAIYPGSFDPVTNGHLDIISRSRLVFSRVVVSVLINQEKQPLFTAQERVQMLRDVTKGWDNVEVEQFEGLLVNYAVSKGARVILRGIRAVSDFEYEFEMALMNRRMRSEIETVFLLPSTEFTFLSSSLVKEVVALGGTVEGLVPDTVARALRHKLQGSTLRSID